MPNTIGLYAVIDKQGNASVCLAVDADAAGARGNCGEKAVKLGSVTLESGTNIITSADMKGHMDVHRVGEHLISTIASRVRKDSCFKFKYLCTELAMLLCGVFK